MFFEKWFIKNEKLLLESSDCDDLLNWKEYIKNFSDRIDEFHWSNIWWFVWQFWIGKSTLIRNIKQFRNKQEISGKWFEFDAWKYPDR